MTLFQTIADATTPNLYAVFGEPVTLTHDGEEIEINEAIAGFPANRSRDAEMQAIWAEYAEWTVRASSLGEYLPERGDEIEAENGVVWRVTSPEGMPVYEYCDAEQKEVRIFCKMKES